MRLHTISRKPNKKGAIKVELLLANPKFQAAVNQVRQKWDKDFSSIPFFFHFLDDDEFCEDLKTVLKIAKLHNEWQMFVAEYIVSNKVQENFCPDLVYIEESDESKDLDPITGEPTYRIRVFPTTTKQDLLAALSYMKREMFSKGKIPRTRSFKNLDRDAKITELRQAKKTRVEINREMVKIHGERARLDKGQMANVVAKFKKRLT